MDDAFRYCPRCRELLIEREESGRKRLACPRSGCGSVHYGNPLPVVAAVVEHEGNVLLVRNKGWPEKWFGLVTGFLEANESPEEAIVREVSEELGLTSTVRAFIGVYAFVERNELIVAYHVEATGAVRLGAELADYRAIAPDKVRPWSFGTGLALRDWLERRNH